MVQICAMYLPSILCEGVRNSPYSQENQESMESHKRWKNPTLAVTGSDTES